MFYLIVTRWMARRGLVMKRKRLISKLLCCTLLASSFRPMPTNVAAQETPRTEPTASAPDAGMLPPPSTRPTTQPATRPAAAAASLAERFPTLRGTDGFWRVGKDASGVWWFISPKGEAEFLNTVTTVQPSLVGRQ